MDALDDGRAMVWVSVTRLRVRSVRFLPGFAWYALRSNRQARQAAGMVGMELLADRERTFLDDDGVGEPGGDARVHDGRGA